MKKAVLCFFLTLAILISVLPVSVNAVEIGQAETGDLPNINVSVKLNSDYTVTATWNEVSGANLYAVWFMGYDPNYYGNGTGTFRQIRSAASVPAFKGCSYTFSTEFTSEYGYGHTDYRITVAAYDGANNKTAEGESNVFKTNLPIIPSPQLTFSDTGIVTWTQVANVGSVAVILYKKKANERVYSQTVPISELTVDFSEYMERGVEYYVWLDARNITPGYRGFAPQTSDFVISADNRKYIDDVEWSGNTLYWDEFPDANIYGLRLYKDTGDGIVQVGNTVSTYKSNYDFSSMLYEYGTGTYKVKLQAWGHSSDVLSKDTFSPQKVYYCPDITSFEVFGITEPMPGEKPVANCQIPNGCGYRTVLRDHGNLQWYNEDGDILDPDTFVFKAGEKYNAHVTLTATEGHEFAESGLTGTMNGKDATKSIFIAKKKKTIYMSRWFTCPSPGTVSVNYESYLDPSGRVIFKLMRGGSVKYTAFATGNSGSYSIPSIPPGDYTLRVSKTNHVTRDYALTVDGNCTLNVKIHPIGDIDGDGDVTTFDYAQCNAHAKGVRTLKDYAFDCANVAGDDDEVTTLDAARINAAAKGVKPLW